MVARREVGSVAWPGSVLLAALAWGWLAACQPAPPTGPVEVYLAFYRAIAEQDPDLAVGYLVPEARQVFEQIGRRLGQAVGHLEDPLRFFLRGVRAEVRRPLVDLVLLEQDGDRARIRVQAGACSTEEEQPAGECTLSEVALRRLDGQWRIEVELPEALVEAAGLPNSKESQTLRGGR